MFKQYEQFNDLASKCFVLDHWSVLDCTEAVEAKDCFSKRLFWHFGHFWQKCFGGSLLARACQQVFQQQLFSKTVFQQGRFSKGVLASFSQFQQQRLSKCFSNSVLVPFWPFSTKAFQQEIVLAFGRFNTGFLA